MDLEQQIAQGKVDPVYVLGGGEPLLIERVVAALVEKVVEPATRAFNFDVLEAKAAAGGAAAILNAARTLPMMAKRRLVLVREADLLGAALGDLAPYLDHPSPETVLVLVCGKIDGRIKFFQQAKKKGVVHELEAPRQVVPWILDEARRKNARISSDAARRLGDVVGNELGRLSSVIDQLSLYAGDRAITAEDVDELVAETRERTVFELNNAVGEGNRKRALHAVSRLFEQRESAVGVTVMLARHVRQLAAVKEAVDARIPSRDLPRIAGVPPFAVDGLVAQARRFSHPSLKRAVGLLAQADLDLKGPKKSALGERVVMEKLVEDLLELAGAR